MANKYVYVHMCVIHTCTHTYTLRLCAWGVCMCEYVREHYQLTLKAVWAEYKLSADEASIKAAAYTSFCSLWRQLVPHITVMKPMSDLCWICQQNSVAIMRAANTPETAKSQVNKLYFKPRMTLPLPLTYRCSRMLRNIFNWPPRRGHTTRVPLRPLKKC